MHMEIISRLISPIAIIAILLRQMKSLKFTVMRIYKGIVRRIKNKESVNILWSLRQTSYLSILNNIIPEQWKFTFV
jgi:hypothetical protein